MNCRRAAELLRGLARNELSVESEEIDELLGLGLAVEADPDDLALGLWLDGVLRTYTETPLGDLGARDALVRTLSEAEERLKSDWFRIKASRVELQKLEEDRVAMRRALAILGDALAMKAIMKIVEESRQLAPAAQYVACERLGSERYALTHKGFRVDAQLRPRLGRFGDAPLRSFLRTLDKSEEKMRAFAKEVATISGGIGHVRKNREHIVIGLAKVGAPAAQAVQAYGIALQLANGPNEAVVCVRNAATFGSTQEAARRLGEAQAALRHVGYPTTPIVLGAAKSLLGFALEPGIRRFVEIHQRLKQAFGGAEEVYIKFTARLMPAAGMPADIVGRVNAAALSLHQAAARKPAQPRDVRPAAVALASMVKTQEQIPEIVKRFRAIEAALVRSGISVRDDVESDALECIACPGTPEEVAATVSALLSQIASGWQPERGDVAIAVAFAKRFAF